MSKNVDIELLEKYVGGEIEAHEVRDIDGAVLSEQDLLEATLDYKEAVMGLEVAGFRKGLQQAAEAYAPAKRSSRPWWFAAGGVVPGMGAFTLVTVEPQRFGHADRLNRQR